MNEKIVEQGAIIQLSNECYSDYHILGVFRARRHFDMFIVCEIYKQDHAQERIYGVFEKFKDYLIEHGYIELVESEEIHLGEYSTLKIGEY